MAGVPLTLAEFTSIWLIFFYFWMPLASPRLIGLSRLAQIIRLIFGFQQLIVI
jgi:hypothetical protein